jgi:hypothetical protein
MQENRGYHLAVKSFQMFLCKFRETVVVFQLCCCVTYRALSQLPYGMLTDELEQAQRSIAACEAQITIQVLAGADMPTSLFSYFFF